MSRLELFQDKLMEFTGNIQSNKYIKAVSTGLMSGMAVLIAGTVLNILVNLPIPPLTDFLTNTGLLSFLNEVVKIFQLTVPMTCFLITYDLAKSNHVDPIQAGIAGFMNFLLVVPSTFDESGAGSLLFDSLTASNMLTAMVVALLTGALFSWAVKRELIIKLPDTMPSFVASSLSAIPAAIITVFPFVLVRYGFSITEFGSFPNFITTLIAAPLSTLGNGIGGHLVFMFLNSLIWWFGIHNTPVATVAMIVMMPSMTENIMAMSSGQPAPHELSLVSYMMIMQLCGGTGMTIGLSIDTLLFAKSERYKAQGKVQLIPSLFCINEPCMFGMPIILNPIFFVPFVFGPVLCYALFYLGLKLGLYTTPLIMLNGFLPAFLQGFIMGGGIGLAIFCIVITLLTCVIWAPFVIMADKAELKLEKERENNAVL